MFIDNQRMDMIPPNFNFKCDSCEFNCMVWDEINKHKNDIHKQVQIIQKCKICSKTLLQNYELETHVKEHDKTGKFRCGVCGKVFYQK